MEEFLFINCPKLSKFLPKIGDSVSGPAFTSISIIAAIFGYYIGMTLANCLHL